ncbi:MAG: tryptophan synthase subunit alpha [Candidatus Altiarchaeales archaeon ex4484_2]|nr:MAG: tryptophan synthase subunit alpha [Candidatus Altiarchaeales archaeon ex4484_2]
MKIEEKFRELQEKGEGALIGFVTAGDPTPQDTVDIVDSLIEGGVDILELGLPFSDPIADGVVIQKASERSLKAGMNPDTYFRIAGEITSEIPKVCLTYYNLVLQRGLERFIVDCQNSGISGLIVPDLPIEEATPLLEACRKHDVDFIFLVAPTTMEDRLQKILGEASGFLYVVSVLGVTGAREGFSKAINPTLRRIKKLSPEIPLAVGFGISKPEHVKGVLKAGAQGVIVGSAFVKIIEGNRSDIRNAKEKIKELCRELKNATRNK